MPTDADPVPPARRRELQQELLRRARAARRTTTVPAAAGDGAAAGASGGASRDAAPPAPTHDDSAPREHGGGRAPLSRAQRRMWLMERLGGSGDSYHVPFATRVRGPFDPAALGTALTGLVRRHGILRTRYAQHDGEPYQEVLPAPPAVPVPVVDSAEAEAGPVLEREAARPFDLSAGEAVRALVLRHGQQDHTVLLTFHHIAVDGGSLETVAGELAGLYTAAVEGTGGPGPAAPPQYADHARREHAEARGLEAELRRWSGLLAGATPPRLPRPAAAAPDSAPRRAAVRTVPLAPRLPGALRALGAERRATLFAVALTAAFAALHRLTGEDDLVIGVAGTHRRGTAMRGLVGLCVNTLPVRVDTSGDPSFAELLDRVRDALLEAQRHRHIPFDLLLERLGAGARGADGTGLVRVTSDVLGEPAVLRLPGTSAEYLDVAATGAKFDLSYGLGLGDEAEPVALVQYDGAALDDAVAEATARHYAELLDRASADPDLPLSGLPAPGPVTGPGTAGVPDPRDDAPDAPGAEVPAAGPGPNGPAAAHDGATAGTASAEDAPRDSGGSHDHPAAGILRAHPRVADATVVRPAEGPALAYAVLRDGVGPARDALLGLLRRSLAPEYVPATVTLLDVLPRGTDGAVDATRLPGLTAPSAPTGPHARAVTEGFTALLGLVPSPDDDFFALGGHSLVAVQLAERLRTGLGLPLTGLDVLQARTPRALSALLDRRAAERTAARTAKPASSRTRPRGSRTGTVLVTGATGGVGAFVLRELAARGRPVLALARPESAHLVAAEGVDVVEGDLTDLGGLRDAVAGADAIVHAACTFTRPEVDLAAMEAMVAAWRSGPFVFVSSVDAYGHPDGDRVAEESSSSEPLSPYGRAKLDCEAMLLRAAGTEGRGGASAVRSPIVWGAHDRLREQLRWGATGRLFQAAREGGPIELPRPDAGGHPWYGVAWVHAAALARAVADCLDRPVHGVANACSGHVSWRDLAGDLTELLGTPGEFRETDDIPRDLDHHWHYDSARLAAPLRARPGEERRTVLADMIGGMSEGDG
ncbi:condensation domain-containing protein [Streptomyces wuyuanensis]|uniref:Nucleoside-diphosphate-sugar epimerase n=1 Tax=Streptomyces wuyuanensis TaxID=1196353 RepID=A0A1G9PRD6_9ACTN|nr:condensation domain-containing protein [Streptomyces wuyuanensis]SDM01388.1 Nucleoside-diphosphate-sugar epimerase [Streptomyces wuyuanensis]